MPRLKGTLGCVEVLQHFFVNSRSASHNSFNFSELCRPDSAVFVMSQKSSNHRPGHRNLGHQCNIALLGGEAYYDSNFVARLECQ